MRNSTRRKQKIWFVLRTVDDSGLDRQYTYSKPIMRRFSVSTTNSSPVEENFGILPQYSRYFTSYRNSQISDLSEGMYMYVDKEPELDANGYLVLDEENEPTVKPDYLLHRIYQTKRGTISRCYLKQLAHEDEDGD